MGSLCKFCKKPILHNRVFYDLAFDETGIQWQQLEKEKQGELISQFRKKGIFRKLNPDGSSHICGQDNEFMKELESKMNEKLESLKKEITQKISSLNQSQINQNLQLNKLINEVNELKNNLSGKIEFYIKEIMKK